MKKSLLIGVMGCFGFCPSALATSGMSYSMEMLAAPLGKQVELISETGTPTLANGRETAEWFGLEGYTDINAWFRTLYGLQGTFAQGGGMLKASGSLAVMVPYDYKFPITPYVFLGLDPILYLGDVLDPLGLAAHAGLGVEYNWNQTLYSQFELRTYLLGPYRNETTEQDSPSNWLPGTFSLRASVGFNY